MRIEIIRPVEKILKKESKEIKRDLSDILQKLEWGERLDFPHIKPLASIHPNLHEIRISDRKGAFRAVYYVKRDDAIVVIHAFRKKTQKISTKEKKVVLNRLKEIDIWLRPTLIKV